MTWKLYALASGGAFLATFLVSFGPEIQRTQARTPAVPHAVDRSGSVVDLGEQADRLRARIAEVSSYRQPARDAFRFGASRRAEARPEPAVLDVPPAAIVAPVTRPPFALAGVAGTVEDGVTQWTAILSSLQGVQFAREGDVVGGYRVVTVEEGVIVVESTVDGTQTTLRLSGSEIP